MIATALPDSEAVVAFVVFAGIAITWFFSARSIDKAQFDDYAKKRGWRVLDVSWDPFGKGWFGEKNDRIYLVRYQTSEGSVCVAWMKTSAFSGVYVSDTALIDPGFDAKLKKQFAQPVSCPTCGVTTPANVPYCPHCRRPARLLS